MRLPVAVTTSGQYLVAPFHACLVLLTAYLGGMGWNGREMPAVGRRQAKIYAGSGSVPV